MSDVNNIYQLIAEKITAIIPDAWRKIHLYAEVFPDMRGCYFYFESATSDNLVYSLNIPKVYGVDRRIFSRLNDELWDICTVTLHGAFSKQSPDPWANFTMYLDRTGEFNIKYNYEQHNYNPSEQQAIWAYEVLGIYPSDPFSQEFVDKFIQSKKT